MSNSNIELLRRSVDELWNTGQMDRYMEIYAEDAELQPDAGSPTGDTVRGREPIQRFFEKIHAPVAPGVFEDHDGGVLMSFAWHAGDAAASTDAQPDWTLIYTFRDGKVTRAQYFRNREDALSAVDEKADGARS